MFDTKFLEMVVTNFGIGGLVLVVIALVLLKFSEIKKFFRWVRSTPERIRNTTPEDLLLSKLDYWIKFKIPNLKLNDPGRQLIFRDILRLKYVTFQTFVSKLKSDVREDMNGQELFLLFVDTFNSTVDSYERQSIEFGIPEAVMVKYGEWQLKSYEYTVRAAELICLSNGYGSNTSRVNACYSLITALMELTIAEAEKSLVELNGELSGTEYRGVICG